MRVSHKDLYRIVIEEYLRSEGLSLSEAKINQAAEDLLKQIQGDKYRPPEERDPARYANKDGNTSPMEKPHTPADETMPVDLDIPSDDAPERDMSGFQDPPNPAEAIYDMLKGVEHNEAVDILTFVAEKLGLSPPEEEEPPSPYSGKAIAQRKAQLGMDDDERMGFEESTKLDGNGLIELIYEVMNESSWGTHSMSGVPGNRDSDEHSKCIADSTDKRVKDAVAANAERIIVFDPDCNLMNPEEIDATLADLEGGMPLDDLYPPEMY